ncbi:MAG: hypothetical protein KDB53_00080, partial [Planctomycetes bacterium]|nr:hypothetical protein [Planctomycetota bacterium]
LGIFAAVEFVAGISGAMTQLLGGPAWVGRLGAGVALIVLIKASVVWARYSRDRRWMRRLRDRFRKSPVNEAAS